MIPNQKSIDLDRDIVIVQPNSFWCQGLSDQSKLSAHEYYFTNMTHGKTIDQLRGDLRRKEKQLKGCIEQGYPVPKGLENEIGWLKQVIKNREQEETKNGG